MSCTDSTLRIVQWLCAGAVIAAVIGCATSQPGSEPTPTQQPAAKSTSRSGATSTRSAPTSSARNWDEYRVQAARRIVEANPKTSHSGTVQQPSLAIPVLDVELNADGSVRAVKVMREPSQAKDTTRIAVDAVRRAAPFGDVSHLPKPWRFSEAFLFNDDRRFKPRSLD